MTKHVFTSLSTGLRRSVVYCLVALSASAFTGCIDDKYDLDDIDSSVRLKVDNLTLPIKLDAIELKTIISDPKPGDMLQIVDGEYALLRTGNFKSSKLTIDPITIKAPETRPSVTTFTPDLPTGVRAKAAPTEISFYIKDKDASPMHYTYSEVSEDILDITGLGASWKITYNVTIEAVGNSTSNFELRNLLFQLPKGLKGTPSLGTYDPTTGVITLKDYQVVNNKILFEMAVNGFDAKEAGVKFDATTHSLEFDAETGVIDGEIVLKIDDISLSGIPTALRVSTDLELSPIAISTFSGKIKYNIDAFNIDPIKLNDLPDVLSQQGTDISLANPQIYIDLNNPFSTYGVYATTGFKIIAERSGQTPVTSEINDKTFKIIAAPKSYYCLSPSKPEKYYNGYENAIPVPFTQFSSALAGDGLPQTIKIDLNPTVMPAQDVENFRLGDYDPVEGNYVFFSPLALGANSKIVYSSTEDGWADEDLNKLTIESMEVTTEIANEIPFDIELSATPVTLVPCPNAKITPVTVKGGQTQSITIKVEGPITHLDGIEFTARAISENATTSLKPLQTITLTNTKVTVSGFYDDEL